ncbi:hypothetical protein BDV06DRAFT_184420 [Aspergillus oleicola]
MTGKKIECYIDVVSPYSFYAFDYLQKNRTSLEAQNKGHRQLTHSGNKPPWELPAKAAYSKFDTKRAQQYFGHDFSVPDFFPILSLLPQRALIYIKKNHPKSTFESTFNTFFNAMWNAHIDISKLSNLTSILAKSTLFSEPQIKEILAGASSPEIKQSLTDTTAKAVKELGAFGCPWFWVSDGKGHAEPFFGSDRWAYMWRYLGLEFEDLRLVSPEGKGKEKGKL